MLFRIQISNASPELARAISARNLLIAKSLILSYPFGASERILDNYLRTTFKKGLVDCCLTILFKLVKSSSKNNEVVYLIPDDYWDSVAQIITCGIGDTPGSRILVDSISGIY